MAKSNPEIFQFFADSTALLYHYTSMDVFIDHILGANQLKVGRYLNTNDPKETKDWSFSVGTNQNRDFGDYDLRKISASMTRGMKLQTNVVCFTQDRALSGNHLEDIHNRGFCRPRMWAQYAKNHEGVCLIFNRDSIKNGISQAFPGHTTYHGPVTYLNRSVVPDLSKSPYIINIDYLEEYGEEGYLAAHIHTHVSRLFFEKAQDWRDEVEYRWVLFGNDEKDLFFDLGDSLVGIVFGTSCDEERIKAAVEITERQGRALWTEQLVWTGCAPWVSWKFLPFLRDLRKAATGDPQESIG